MRRYLDLRFLAPIPEFRLTVEWQKELVKRSRYKKKNRTNQVTHLHSGHFLSIAFAMFSYMDNYRRIQNSVSAEKTKKELDTMRSSAAELTKQIEPRNSDNIRLHCIRRIDHQLSRGSKTLPDRQPHYTDYLNSLLQEFITAIDNEKELQKELSITSPSPQKGRQPDLPDWQFAFDLVCIFKNAGGSAHISKNKDANASPFLRFIMHIIDELPERWRPEIKSIKSKAQEIQKNKKNHAIYSAPSILKPEHDGLTDIFIPGRWNPQ